MPAATTVMPMFPLGSTLLPGETLPLRIFEPRYREMLADCIESGDLRFGVVLIERGSEVGGGDTRTDIGTVAEVLEHQESRNGTWALLCRGSERIRIDEWLPDDPYPRARVTPWPDETVTAKAWDIWLQRLETAAHDLIGYSQTMASITERQIPIPSLANARLSPDRYTWDTAGFMPITQSDRHRALAAPDPITRAKILIGAIGDADAALRFRLRED